jgi:hypothetical protein
MHRDIGITVLTLLAVLVVWHGSADTAALRVSNGYAQAQQFEDESTQLQAQRDSLARQLRKLQVIMADLRQSFGEAREESLLVAERHQEIIDLTVQEFGGALAEIRKELAGIEIEIDGNTIELTGEDGDVVAIAIPENLGEQISKGISSVTRVVLDELPDTVRIVTPRGGEWSYEAAVKRPPRAPRFPRHRKFVHGDAVRFRDDMIVGEDEEVLGNVVVVFGDALISGRVDGDVVVVFGDLRLDETAEVTGEIVTVLGRFDRAEEATVGSVVVVDPRAFDLGPGDIVSGWAAFLIRQGFFLVTLLLVLGVVAITPRPRFANVQRALHERSGYAFGLGLVVTLIGYAALVLVGAVLVLTVIGIPLALLLILAVALLSLVAIGAASVPVGSALLRARPSDPDRPFLEIVVGMCVLHLVSFLAALFGGVFGGETVGLLLGALGVGIKALAYLFGIGALALSRLGSRAVAVTAPPLTGPPATDPDAV